MSHSISFSYSLDSSSDVNDIKTQFKVPLTAIGSKVKRVYPLFSSTVIAAGSSETINLSANGQSKIKSLSIKATRPIKVSLSDGTDSFNSPFSTFYSFANTSGEGETPAFTSITVTVAAVPPTNPPGSLPYAYPKAIVEFMIVSEDID